MFTVALIGPDGAGKTTIGRRLEHTLPLPVKYVYMGINLEASNHMLPTTRLIQALRRLRGAGRTGSGPPDPDASPAKRRSAVKRLAYGVKAAISLTNRICEEWFRQLVVWSHTARGHIVLLDRHFYSDYYAFDIAGNGRRRPLDRRIHGFMLERLYPKPDLVIYLDAPAEILFARKQEGTIESLERRREAYLEMRRHVKHFAVVDASQPEEQVARIVTDLIWQFHANRGKRAVKTTNARQG